MPRGNKDYADFTDWSGLGWRSLWLEMLNYRR